MVNGRLPVRICRDLLMHSPFWSIESNRPHLKKKKKSCTHFRHTYSSLHVISPKIRLTLESQATCSFLCFLSLTTGDGQIDLEANQQHQACWPIVLTGRDVSKLCAPFQPLNHHAPDSNAHVSNLILNPMSIHELSPFMVRFITINHPTKIIHIYIYAYL